MTAAAKGSESAPLALALGLVALAAWGVVLVVRARTRRFVSAARRAGDAPGCSPPPWSPSPVPRTTPPARSTNAASPATSLTASLTGWYWATLVGGVLALVAFAAALRLAPGWPAMGTRYDAPATRAAQEEAAPASEQDMWRALDDGRDPTA